ncbi:MAG: 16S rRNA (guanine(527)-N(7))-methyltransferase RsmG [Oscillospiraceae bacterium]|nr:16S rRNA (guanine(527)-N(7))-methyltransferase RsmG [Oscillospiraceae bacterium]
MIDKKRMADILAEYEIAADDVQLDRLDQYAEMLVDWNTRMNLTGITEPHEIEVKHFLDSILLLKGTDLAQNARMIDVGCGAGFPSLPCKICRPDMKLTMLDSLNKRIVFLQAVGEALALGGIDYIHGRAEEVSRQKQHREKYDLATARAVAHLRELSEYCLPFVKVGGVFAALKGYEIETELDEAANAIKKLGGKVEAVKKFELPMDNSRSIVVIRKISQTPPLYPRTPSKMTKSPL